MNNTNMRTVSGNIRALPQDDSHSMIVEGYAAIFNEPSQPMPFIEYIEPNALQGADLSNVLALYDHEFGNILGRTDSETLTLKVDDKGLFFSCQLPDTQLGHDTYQNVANGNIKGCSFRFDIDDDIYSLDDNGNQIHTIKKISNVTEISLTTLPAYTETSVQVKRSLDLLKGENSMNNDEEAKKQFELFKEWLAKQQSSGGTGSGKDNPDPDPEKDKSEKGKNATPPAQPAGNARDGDDGDDPEIREDPTKEKGAQRSMAHVIQQGNSSKKPHKDEAVRSFEDYVRSRGEKRDGVTTIENQAVIPTQILQAQKEKISPNLLKNYVNRQTVSAPKGTLPVIKKASAGLVTKAELDANPKMEMGIESVDYSVETYAGAIPISQEMIDDAAVDISGIVGEHAQDLSDITEQRKIGAALATATKKVTVKTADDLKTAFNKKVPSGYDKVWVMSQSFYDYVDKLKDANGRYLFQDSLSSPSGKALSGKDILPVDDEILGKEGEAHAFVGDLKSFILDAVKKETSVRWQDNDIYAQKLAIYLRFDVKKAIDEAGVFLTWDNTPVTGGGEDGK